jgi:hypothetical protein
MIGPGTRIILRVVDGPGAGTETTLEADRVVEVGRRCRGLAIHQDEYLSGQHFLVVRDGPECRIRDLSSTNGTFLNGKRIVEATLRNLDEIRAGSSTFVLRVEPELSHSPKREPVSDRTEGERDLHRGRPSASQEPSAGTEDMGPTPGRVSVEGDADITARLAETPSRGELLQITNRTPFRTATLYWQDEQGRAKLTIIVKATFAMGTPVTIAREQVAIYTRDVPHDGGPGASVRFESDLVPQKPRADVVLVGRAHAPQHRAVTQLIVGLRVGNLRHAVAVFGDRTWEYQWLGSPTMSKPVPFTTMDLVYERAFGGMDAAASMYCAENMVGTGYIGKPTRERISGLRLPNLEDRTDLIRAWDSRPRPAGFGFYGRGWMPRLEQAGTLGFFNGAHPSLQGKAHLKGDEEVELVNVSSEPHVRFQLPGMRPAIRVTRWIGATEPPGEEKLEADRRVSEEDQLRHETLHPVLDTLVLIPDEGVFYEVFRAVCDLPSLDSVDVARVSISV